MIRGFCRSALALLVATLGLGGYVGYLKPLLIHCQSGADRSGPAAALYLAAIARHGEAAAEDQLSIRYGHIGLPHVSSAYAMGRTWETLERWLGFAGS